ncbi:MAG: sugar transferase [Methylobacteriaceae bacterium]|nr:sugar transferase [Methylobacteriaceae bacterium]
MAIVFATATISFVFFRLDSIPRSLPIIHLFILVSLLCAGRILTRTIKRKDGAVQHDPTTRRQERLILVGVNRLTWLYIQMLDQFGFSRHSVVGILGEGRLVGRQVCGRPVIGEPSMITNIIREYSLHGIDIAKIIVTDQTSPPHSEAWQSLVSACDAEGVTAEYLPEHLGLLGQTADKRLLVESTKVWHASLAEPPRYRYWRAKRALDLLIVILALPIFCPIIFAIYCCIWLRMGFPAVFWQERLGMHGQPFRIYKFRTLLAPFDSNGRPVPEEDRLSKFGKFLRETRLDELPQLVNVLRGDMALVGPRPLLPVDQPKDRSRRLDVRPGITGWAQVRGGKLVGAEEKGALDEWYIRHASLALDMRVLYLTVRTVLLGDRRCAETASPIGELDFAPSDDREWSGSESQWPPDPNGTMDRSLSRRLRSAPVNR